MEYFDLGEKKGSSDEVINLEDDLGLLKPPSDATSSDSDNPNDPQKKRFILKYPDGSYSYAYKSGRKDKWLEFRENHAGGWQNG